MSQTARSEDRIRNALVPAAACALSAHHLEEECLTSERAETQTAGRLPKRQRPSPVSQSLQTPQSELLNLGPETNPAR